MAVIDPLRKSPRFEILDKMLVRCSSNCRMGSDKIGGSYPHVYIRSDYSPKKTNPDKCVTFN